MLSGHQFTSQSIQCENTLLMAYPKRLAALAADDLVSGSESVLAISSALSNKSSIVSDGRSRNARLNASRVAVLLSAHLPTTRFASISASARRHWNAPAFSN